MKNGKTKQENSKKIIHWKGTEKMAPGDVCLECVTRGIIRYANIGQVAEERVEAICERIDAEDNGAPAQELAKLDQKIEAIDDRMWDTIYLRESPNSLKNLGNAAKPSEDAKTIARIAPEFMNPFDKARRTYTKPPGSRSRWP